MKEIIAIFIGAGFGALLRYYFQGFNTNFPLGTLLANVLGSFLIGFIFFLIQESNFNAVIKPLLITGFLGALTTYSTINIELLQFLLNKEYQFFTIYFILNSICGLLAVFLGKKTFDLFSAFVTL